MGEFVYQISLGYQLACKLVHTIGLGVVEVGAEHAVVVEVMEEMMEVVMEGVMEEVTEEVMEVAVVVVEVVVGVAVAEVEGMIRILSLGY